MQQGAKKVASRFLLPLEMYLGVVMVAWGLAGGIGSGPLHRVLETSAHPYLDDVWVATLCGVGAAQLLIGVIEWANGREWALDGVWRSARFRTSIAFVAGLIWMWVLKMVFDVGFTSITVALLVQTPASIVMEVWVFWENYRVRLAADQSVPTSNIIFKR